MLRAIIEWSLRHRVEVVALTITLAAWGANSLMSLPIDAFPDTTPVMVQINAVAPALGPEEIEQQVTMPIERAIAGQPSLTEVRSISKFGFCQTTAVFADGTPIYLARQMVQERLATVDLPEGLARPEAGPITSGLGEILHYIISSPVRDLTELTELHDWEIKPLLVSVAGVAEINTWGGLRKQYHVLVDPALLIKHDLQLSDVLDALRHNNLSAGGGTIEQSGELHVVYGLSLTTNPAEIGAIVITAVDGVPIRVRDVAEVRTGHEIRRGGVTANGQGEVVHGLGFMVMGENSHEVTRRLEARLNECRKNLPPDVELKVVYARTELVDRVIATVRTNLLEGALLVVAVLFAFLGNLRAGLIVALAIPLSMLFAFSAMLKFGIAASLLSLGAIDFGLIVDSAVISVENSVRRLGETAGDAGVSPAGASGERIDVRHVVRDAAVEVRRPTMFGELIIMIVYVPILLLEGVEGKLFRPMALTVIFALSASLVLSLTLIPVLSSLFLRPKRVRRDRLLVRAAQSVYRPMLKMALSHRAIVCVAALGLLGGGAWLALRLGAEFIPRLSEMAITLNAVRLSGVSLDESLRYSTRIERVVREEFPDEVRDVWSRTGTAEIATDPMGLEVTDVFVTLTPRAQWKKARTQEELEAKLNEALTDLPGMNLVFSQPIEMRINEMLAGIRADVGVKLFGDDLEVLKASAGEVADVLSAIPGAQDVSVEQITGLPVLEVRIDQDAVARYGVPAAHVLEVIEALGGIKAGEIREGQRRFDLVARLPDRFRENPDAVRQILIQTVAGERIPLTHLATIREIEGPATISREWQKRRIIVQCNVRGRDLGGFVGEAQRRLAELVVLPQGYFLQFGGRYEHLIRASLRLSIIAPLALGAVLVLLYLSTRSLRDALIVFTGAPFAALGGVLALWLRDMPFTISAGVGFVAVSGVSMLNGLVLVSTIKQQVAKGLSLNEAIEKTRLLRLRPILMTALVAALGFAPMAFNTGVGAEVQRPLATVVIGGVIADNLLTVLVLPALYSLAGSASRGRRTQIDEPATAPT